MDLPSISLPAFGGHTVRVSVINGARTHISASLLVEAAGAVVVPQYLGLACYSFLIESQHHQKKYLFDLALMKDVASRMPPALQALQKDSDGGIDEQAQIDVVLQHHGYEIEAIDGIILSHGHIDHVGDPSVFPTTTRLIVGPGFRTNRKLMPGYPLDPNAHLPASAFEGREVQEVDFSRSSLRIGNLLAIDFLNDGSLYLLHAPGHTEHHMMALARTTDETWILMAGDSCHSVAQLRPNQYRPLSEQMRLSTMGTTIAAAPTKISGKHVQQQHLSDCQTVPFYGSSAQQHENRKVAVETAKTVMALDGHDAVFVILAHDASILDTIDCFPKVLNGWKEKEWAERSRWAFLQTLEAQGQPDALSAAG